MARRPARVVDFARYRAARAAGRLPLFDAAPAGAAPVPVLAARALTPREVEHRRAMLAHLGARRGGAGR